MTKEIVYCLLWIFVFELSSGFKDTLTLTIAKATEAADLEPQLNRQSLIFEWSDQYELTQTEGLRLIEDLEYDVDPWNIELDVLSMSSIKTRPITVYRPHSPDDYQHSRWRSLSEGQGELLEWVEVEILGPDVEDRHTLQQLARMTGDAYARRGQKNWYDLDDTWNTSFPFGWEDPENGFRGHLFVSSDNSTVVLAIKGTTLQGPTSKKDKFNDNLLFSCCCARVDITWMFATVCNCYSKNWKCEGACLSEALVQDSLFYSVGVTLFNDVKRSYPEANIWLTGHSLGGALASLLGTTFGVPAIAFESPGEKLAAERLHLPLHLPSPVTHIYHNADPVAQGKCNGIRSVCAQVGFALETGCHLGKSIVYDTIGAYGWKVDVRRHPIRELITGILQDEREWEDGRQVPLAREEEDCIDCYKWDFV